MFILYFVAFMTILGPTLPTPKSGQPPQCPPQKNASGETIHDFCKEIVLRTKCGQKATENRDAIRLPPGHSYVDHNVEVLKSDPRTNACLAAWDPKIGLKVTCKCEPHDRCAKDDATGEWSGPDSELRVRIHLYAKKTPGQ